MDSDLREAVDRLQEWQDNHDERHVADTKILSSMVDAVNNSVELLSLHLKNEHSLKHTAVRTGGLAAFFSALLVALVEILQRFVV